MDFYVFDLNFNRLGIIDDYANVEIKTSYDSLGSLKLNIDGSKEMVDLLQIDRIITKTTDFTKGYIIKTREYLDEKSTELEINAPSLNVILNDRLILGQQEFTGTIENVMKSFVSVNAVNPSNTRRVIPNLVIAANRGIDITASESTVNKYLCDYLYELSKKHDVSFDLSLDHTNKKIVFDVWQGVNRSTEQLTNPHVIFAKDFDNVIKQNYVESVVDLKTTAIVFGEEDENGQKIIAVNDNLSGFNRKEIFVQSRNKKTYKDENDVEIILTEEEYGTLLVEDGSKTLAEYLDVRTFESDVDAQSNFVYGVDYFLGDKVSVKNDELNLILHTRIISVTEKFNKQGFSLQLKFGNNIPTLLEKVKREIKNSSSGGTSKSGQSGSVGVGLDFTVSGTSLGVKREDEASYVYMELKGDTGSQGPAGPPGPKGETGLQGSQGVKGDTGPQGLQGPQGIQGPMGPAGPKGDKGEQGIQGLQGIPGPKGDKGDTGLQGPQGLKGDTGVIGPQGPIGLTGPQGDVGPQGEQGPKGEKGDKPAHQWSGTSLRFENPNGTYGVYVNLKGEKGDAGPQGPQGEQGIPGPPGEGIADNIFVVDGITYKYRFGVSNGALVFEYEEA